MNKSGIIAMLFIALASTECKERKRHYIQMGKKVTPELKWRPLKIDVEMGDFLDINCPQYDPLTKQKIEKFNLYQANNKELYKDCKYENKTVVLSCTTPYIANTLTLKFQTRSPSPLGFKFNYGLTYYYIAIPVGERTCHNAMRLEIHVAKEKFEHNVVMPEIEEVHKPATEKPNTTKPNVRKSTKPNPKLITTTKKVVAASQRGNGASSVTNFKFLISLLALLALRRNL